MKTPIALIIFNRPDNVAKLLQGIYQEKDRELFIISDGPRKDKPGEAEKVQLCRAMFKKWSGKVHVNYADENLGCKSRVSTGLTWVFENTDRAIVLEDDCLPHRDFFRFADEMLEKFKDDSRVMSICGTNLFPDKKMLGSSYFFSKYQNCWGWATWRRSWDLFDRDLECLDMVKESRLLQRHLGSRRAAMYWHHILNRVKTGRVNSWAYIWTFSAFLNNGVHVIPQKNLIENFGFGSDSTHTERAPSYVSPVTTALDFPLSHPPAVFPHTAYDTLIEDIVFSKSLCQRLLWVIRKLLKR